MDVVIKSFAQFVQASNAKDAGLVIIGKGEESDNLRTLAQKLGISDRVIFTGFLNNPYPWFKKSQVFISASQNEGISNAMLEAMYLNNIPISSNVGGADEFIRHGSNGFIFAEKLQNEISKQLHKLYVNNQMRQEIAGKAHQTIIDQFSMDEMKNRIMEFCQYILSK